MSIATRLRETMQRKGMTESDLAREMGCTRQMIHRYTSGDIPNVGINTLVRMVRAMEVSMEEFFKGWK